MIVCNCCGFKSLDFEHFGTRLIFPPRGLTIDPNLSENDKRFIELKTKFLFMQCPQCGERFTSKPDEDTVITLERKDKENAESAQS